MSKSDSLPQIKPAKIDNEGAKLTDPPVTLPFEKTQTSDDLRAFIELLDALPLALALKENAGLRNFLTAVFAFSPYLRDLSLKFPDTVNACHTQGFDTALSSILAEMAPGGDDYLDEALVMKTLRLCKRQAALVCGLADLGGWWSSAKVSQGVSDTADRAVQVAVRHLLLKAHSAGKLQLPDVDEPETGSGYNVIAMGKHGAGELNYSSDIDLIVFVDPDAPAVLDRDESVVLYGRMTKSLVKIMQDWTDDGYVFRSDLRLRPDPGSMPIAVPVALAMHYYESRGQNWERAALIKARSIAGDLVLGDGILSELQPFIWRRYLDYAAIADVHSIKRQIQAHKGYTELKIPGHNVKLGRGGIREIEFFVQTQQLIAGGRVSQLRGKRTVLMLDELVNHGWVKDSVSEELKESYAYLRDVEHRLQMIGDAQTHTLPDDEAELTAVAYACGFATLDGFAKATQAHLIRVESHYAQLFAQEPELTAQLGNLSFTGDDDDPGTLETLGQLGFERPSSMISIIRGWHFGRYRAMQSTDARERLTEITPKLLECFSDTGKPDEALMAFDEFLKGLPAGFQLFHLLRANPDILDLLVMMLGVAPRLAAIVTRKPHVFDSLLEPGFFSSEFEQEMLRARIDRSLSHAKGYEDGLDRARYFAAEHRFLIGIKLLSSTISAQQAGQAFSMLADVMCSAMLDFVRREFEIRHGTVPGASMAIVGMGNLGTRELTAGSDLDLIVLYEYDDQADTSDGEKPLHASQYFARLTQRLIAAMSAPTAEGVVYELDFRLRPSGNSGPLAITLSSFMRYQSSEAWAWEQLALTRARPVAGNSEFVSKVGASLRELVGAAKAEPAKAKEIYQMRELMDKERPAHSKWDVKLSKGGLVDLEFMAQWAMLAGTSGDASSTREVLERMELPGELKRTELLDAFDRYVSILQLSRVCLNETYGPEHAPRGLTETMMHELDFPEVGLAEIDLEAMQKSIRGAFNTYFKHHIAG